MPLTYTPLATTTVTSAQSTVTFSSISQSYTDLIITAVVLNTGSGSNYVNIRTNGNSSAIYYASRYFYNSGTGSNFTTYSSSGQPDMPSLGWETGYTSGAGGCMYIEVPNYSSSTTTKTIKQHTFNMTTTFTSNGSLWLSHGAINSTSSINSITFGLVGTGQFEVGTTFSMWGVLKA